MALNATLQVRMDSEVKSQVEELYKNLGTSFAEAVRVFAAQSLLNGGYPFRPTVQTWSDMTEEDRTKKLLRGIADAEAGRTHSDEEVDLIMKEFFKHAKQPV